MLETLVDTLGAHQEKMKAKGKQRSYGKNRNPLKSIVIEIDNFECDREMTKIAKSGLNEVVRA